jgi:hypothetical protein
MFLKERDKIRKTKTADFSHLGTLFEKNRPTPPFLLSAAIVEELYLV